MRDINLLPKKSRKISFGAVVILLVLGILYVAVATLFGYLIPLRQRDELNRQINQIEKSIESINASEAEYYLLMQTVNMKRYEGEALLALRNNRLDITEFLDNVEASMPVDIYANALNISGGLLNIEGISLDYNDIARFMVKLRELDKVIDTTFTTATLDKANEGEKYSFNIHSNLEKRDIIEELKKEIPNNNNLEGGIVQ